MMNGNELKETEIETNKLRKLIKVIWRLQYMDDCIRFPILALWFEVMHIIHIKLYTFLTKTLEKTNQPILKKL